MEYISSNNLAIIIGFTMTFVVSALIVITTKYHGFLSLDSEKGVQKFHNVPTPRIGGVALLSGLLASWVVLENEAQELLGLIGIAGLPVLVFGLAEDLFKNVSVRSRMLATITAGMIFVIISGYSIESIHVWWVDRYLAVFAISLGFTALSASAAANSINIIDGFHGLASGTILIMLMSICIISRDVGDLVLFDIALTLAAIVAGFFVVNFPFGKLFLGDAGAYFLGFCVAALVIMLPARNPEVSPWISPLILSYPLTELIVSISRKSLRKGSHPGQPDNLHLHMLVYRTVTKLLGKRFQAEPIKHALTSATLWTYPTVALICIAVSGFESQFAINSILALFAAYLCLYKVTLHYDIKRQKKSVQCG